MHILVLLALVGAVIFYVSQSSRQAYWGVLYIYITISYLTIRIVGGYDHAFAHEILIFISFAAIPATVSFALCRIPAIMARRYLIPFIAPVFYPLGYVTAGIIYMFALGAAPT